MCNYIEIEENEVNFWKEKCESKEEKPTGLSLLQSCIMPVYTALGKCIVQKPKKK